jgi:phytoene/squalene synthetase
MRDPAAACYAFCRIADDLVDFSPDPNAAVVELNARLDLPQSAGWRVTDSGRSSAQRRRRKAYGWEFSSSVVPANLQWAMEECPRCARPG